MDVSCLEDLEVVAPYTDWHLAMVNCILTIYQVRGPVKQGGVILVNSWQKPESNIFILKSKMSVIKRCIAYLQENFKNLKNKNILAF